MQTTVFVFSHLHLSAILEKPFNPIIGETYQTKIGPLDVYFEQTANKPPTSNFYILGPNYKIRGYLKVEVTLGVNSIKGIKTGSCIIEFKDGFNYEFTFPQIEIGGVTVGTRTFNYKHNIVVSDKVNYYFNYYHYCQKNNLASIIKINPDRKNGFFSFFFSPSTYPDTIRGSISNETNIQSDKKNKYKLIDEGKTYCKIDGEWTGMLRFNEVKYWQYGEFPPVEMYKMNFVLPSDSSFREDLIAFIKGDEETSQKCKEAIEEMQRSDRKLKSNYKDKDKNK